MATTYQSPQVQAGLVRGNWRGGSFMTYGVITAASAVLNDIFQLVLFPNGYMIESVTLDVDQLDSNGSPTIVLAVGDGTTAAKFISGATVARTGGIQGANVAGTIGTIYPLAQGGQFAGGNAGATIIQAKVTTAAATFAAGKIRLAVRGYLDPQLGGYT